MPLPETSADIITPSLKEIKRLTPTATDPSVEDEDAEIDIHERSRMSPSPEIDLYSPELGHDSPTAPPSPGEPFSGRSSVNRDDPAEARHRPNRAPSPPLEADERGFTETATAVRARGMSLHGPTLQVSVEIAEPKVTDIAEETLEQSQRRDQDSALELFGHAHPGLQVPTQKTISSSPLINPKHDHQATLMKLNLDFNQDDIDMADAWALRSPEMVDIAELDTIFYDF